MSLSEVSTVSCVFAVPRYSLLCTELRVRVVALVTGEAQVLNPSPSDRSPRFLTIAVLNARQRL